MLSHYERYEPRSTQKHPIRIRISRLKNIYRAASYITWTHLKIVKAVINRDHIPSLVILSENISTKRCHHQTLFGTKALFFVPFTFTHLIFGQIWVSFSIFRKYRDTETPSRHFNMIIIPNYCKMKHG